MVLALCDFDKIYCFAHYLNIAFSNAFTLQIHKLKLFTADAMSLIESVTAIVQFLIMLPRTTGYGLV